MGWLDELRRSVRERVDEVGPGLAYLPASELVCISVPDVMDAYQLSKGGRPRQGTIPYGEDDWWAVVLGCLDGLRVQGRRVLGLSIQLARRPETRPRRRGA